MNWLVKIFHTHKHEFVSMKLNGYCALDHALNIRPEYDAIERCNCGDEIITRYLSYADKPLESTAGYRIRRP